MIKKLIITVIVLFLGISYVSAKEAGGCVILQHNGNESSVLIILRASSTTMR